MTNDFLHRWMQHNGHKWERYTKRNVMVSDMYNSGFRNKSKQCSVMET